MKFNEPQVQKQVVTRVDPLERAARSEDEHSDMAFAGDFTPVLAKHSDCDRRLLTQETDAQFLCGSPQVVVKRCQRQASANGQIEVDRVVAG